MKKVLFTAVAVLGFTFANAQEEGTTSYKPVEGTIATEVGLTGGLNNANFNLNTGVLKFRYFLKEDLAIRAGLGINSNKQVDEDNSNPANVETETFKNSMVQVKLGVEKHFAGSDRLSTYAGADLILGFSGASYEYTENGYSYTESANDTNGNIGGFGFGLGLVTGADYYIAKKVYLGVEAGLNFMSAKQKDNEVAETGNATYTENGSKFSEFNTSVVGGVRIGFQF